MRLADKVALITGASRGIGRAVAEGYGREGAKLFLVGHQDQAALDEVSNQLAEQGVEVAGALCDVGDAEAVRRLADQIDERFGTLDILVNNAGVIRPTPLLEISPEQFDLTVRTHLHGAFFCTVEMVRRFMARHGHGKVINVTAPAALKGVAGVADYASAKGAIIALTRNAARELQPLNIQVNAVLPVAETRMTDALAEYFKAQFGEEGVAGLEPFAPPEAVVPTFVFLASADADYVTGQILAADGGLTA